MKRTSILFYLILVVVAPLRAQQWKPVEGKIMSPWAEEVTPQNVLPEYPRPLMERADWMNLNGLWDYSITAVSAPVPAAAQGKILVPFPVESALSGVGRMVGEENVLWYSREFSVPASWRRNKNILLHFGAVDWRSEIWINDIFVGSHQGGYTPFSFDITPFLKKSGAQQLVVKVWDPTDNGPQPRGKQVNKPHAIWYTPVTGIWQTVWLEPVPQQYLSDIKITPDLDNNLVRIQPQVANGSYGDVVKVEAFADNKLVASAQASASQEVRLVVENARLWSPEDPFLYDLKVTLMNDSREADVVNSYFAMRKVSMKRDDRGIVRFQLNNKDIIHFGPLDQGWWPDGLYAAPTDAALRFDIQKTKDLGYNMIRKHVKVEPARWYTHCDQLGMLVWQDMPNGDTGPDWQMHNYFTGSEFHRKPESEKIFRTEWKAIIDLLYSHPSIAVWVPFNERWGQFKTAEIAQWTKDYDPSRLVNPASGGNHYPVGDMLDLHNYPEPRMYLFDGQRANVLGEYGGIGMVTQGHLWEPDRNWGYVQFSSKEEVMNEYSKYADMLKNLILSGFTGAVYTQTTDVEIEVNGLLTYDRRVLKVDEEEIRKINLSVINVLNENRVSKP